MSRYTTQEVCPWNVRFAQELKEEAFRPCEALAGREPRALARELLEMSQEHSSKALRGSPMKRAKLRGLKRNAGVVLGNVGRPEDVDVLTRALEDPEPLVRKHAAWALARIRHRSEQSGS
ncbi:MAG TPA: HEAT repeat domain-containing protein [Gemmatimonadaceae bacterium]|nr:HEAT repeat domain-containing protein [Gemmatimonadaceae bacterium]